MTLRQYVHTPLIIAVLIVCFFPVKNPVAAAPSAPVDLKPLLLSTRSADAASSADIEALLKMESFIDSSSPDWPVYTFMMGEVFLLRGEKGKALDRYESVINRALSNPHGDGWGGSGLVSASFWRLLETGKDREMNQDKALQLIEQAGNIVNTRHARAMFHSPALDSLPKLEEDMYRHLSLLAWKAGNTEAAQRLFMDYLKISSSTFFSPQERSLLDHLLSAGLITGDGLSLLRGKRFYDLRMFDQAFDLFSDAGKSSNTEVKAEAYYYLSDINQIRGRSIAESVALLDVVIETSHTPDLVEKALFKRAIFHRRTGNIQLYLRDISRITNEFPRGEHIDDALYDLARYYQFREQYDTSLKYFEKLRKLEIPNDWINMSRFQPAMILYSMGKGDDRERAVSLLLEMDSLMPFGPLRFNVLFWLGRIMEEAGKGEEARKYFEQILKEQPFHFFAIRARMHLRSGSRARKELWPDEKTREELITAYKESRIDSAFRGDSPYHRRLHSALLTGLYSTVFDEYKRLRRTFPTRRLEALSLRELDEAGLFTPVCLLLSLRQDALAAKDIKKGSSLFADNFLLIANEVGHKGGDWPLSMGMVIAGREPLQDKSAIQQSRGYLVTAFPPAFNNSINQKGDEHKVKPELLYSIARRESLFNPSALSKRGALGLFQFIPPTFRALDKKWQLLKSKNLRSMDAYLLDPELSIDLGARWFKDELLKHQKGNVLFAIMEHNAGYGAVRSWKEYWQNADRINDVEYMIETIRFAETRIFTRRVLRDLVITDAIGIMRQVQ